MNDRAPDTSATAKPEMTSATGRVLLHACCGPCAIAPTRRLLAEGFEVTLLFHNPNIHPSSEYLRRREALSQAAGHLGVPALYLDSKYDPKSWLREIAFREDNRCFHCYRMRLERARDVAGRGRFDFFSSTLLFSKRQRHEVVRRLCEDLGAPGPVRFLYRDFRQDWAEGSEESKRLGLHRQEYCGCIYSELEANPAFKKKGPKGES